MTVCAGRGSAVASVRLVVADDAKIGIDCSDLSFASPGDKMTRFAAVPMMRQLLAESVIGRSEPNHLSGGKKHQSQGDAAKSAKSTDRHAKQVRRKAGDDVLPAGMDDKRRQARQA